MERGGSIAAFVTGTAPLEEAGLTVVGAHTDSPGLRVKPKPTFSSSGYLQLGVEIYGGVLLASWTDRDLGLAGRVALRKGKKKIRQELFCVSSPVARVPQIAIHLNREVNKSGLVLNQQLHMPPVFGLLSSEVEFEDWLAARLDVEPEEILSWDILLHPIEAPTLGGVGEEFVFAPRLDNLASCHAALAALISAASKESKKTRVIVFNDHEEVGSSTTEGAAGSFLEDVFSRIARDLGKEADALLRAKAQSLFVSVDMAHAVHPNYADRHEPNHAPQLNAGPVIKKNANARYATDAETSANFHRICHDADVPVQEFVVRSDMGCGSTIGPMVATRLGVPTVDVGNPMLSMHSAREMAGSQDHLLMIRALERLFAE